MAQLDKLGLSCYTTWWSLKSFIFCLPQQWQKPAIMVFWGANRQKCVKFNFFFGSYLTLLLSWNKKRAPLFWRHGQKMLPYPLPLHIGTSYSGLIGVYSCQLLADFVNMCKPISNKLNIYTGSTSLGAEVTDTLSWFVCVSRSGITDGSVIIAVLRCRQWRIDSSMLCAFIRQGSKWS